MWLDFENTVEPSILTSGHLYIKETNIFLIPWNEAISLIRALWFVPTPSPTPNP